MGFFRASLGFHLGFHSLGFHSLGFHLGVSFAGSSGFRTGFHSGCFSVVSGFFRLSFRVSFVGVSYQDFFGDPLGLT